MTFIATSEGWLYLAGVIDAYSRKLIGWAMGKEHDVTLVKNALQMALLQREPGAGLVHHSDRGSEYASQSYQDMLHQRGIQVSMSRKGDCYDNAMIESFWGTRDAKKGSVKLSIRHEKRQKRRCLTTSKCFTIEKGSILPILSFFMCGGAPESA